MWNLISLEPWVLSQGLFSVSLTQDRCETGKICLQNIDGFPKGTWAFPIKIIDMHFIDGSSGKGWDV